jgi:RNA polymerase sigma-70 factor, ECF subfamily
VKGEPDDKLLEAARSGDRAALEELLERHQARVYRFGMKMCRDPQDAEDVLQDTLLAAARGVRDFRGGSSISTWLFAIARSYCIKKRRKSRLPQGELGELEAHADPARSPEERLAGRQVELALERAIDELEPAYREVLVLRDVEGLAAADVAKVLGIGVPAVKSRLHRARLAIRNKVAPLLGVISEGPSPAGRCPDVLKLFSRYVEGEIGPEQCARMERHLLDCGPCRGACESLKRTLELCKAAPEAELPPGQAEAVRTAVRQFLAEDG